MMFRTNVFMIWRTASVLFSGWFMLTIAAINGKLFSLHDAVEVGTIDNADICRFEYKKKFVELSVGSNSWILLYFDMYICVKIRWNMIMHNVATYIKKRLNYGEVEKIERLHFWLTLNWNLKLDTISSLSTLKEFHQIVSTHKPMRKKYAVVLHRRKVFNK